MTRGNGAGYASQRRREPAHTHFRKIAAEPRRDALGATPCRFEVYRADEVQTSSIRFVGGDWHWRLCDPTGQVLVDAGGYPDEQACRTAIGVLKDRAALATLSPIA